jgi:hypothetical protein
MAWQLTYGPIPAGEGHHGTCVLHHCDNPPCVNPAHLFLGTNRDNMLDASRKGRHFTYFGEATTGARNPRAKSASTVLAILAASPTLSHRRTAREFGVGDQLVGLIRSGDHWIFRDGALGQEVRVLTLQEQAEIRPDPSFTTSPDPGSVGVTPSCPGERENSGPVPSPRARGPHNFQTAECASPGALVDSPAACCVAAGDPLNDDDQGVEALAVETQGARLEPQH